MKTNNKYIIGLFTLILAYNCTNTSEEDLIDNTPPPELVNFEEDIKVIFENNCWMCHGTTPQFGAQTSLVFYNEVVFGIENNNDTQETIKNKKTIRNIRRLTKKKHITSITTKRGKYVKHKKDNGTYET